MNFGGFLYIVFSCDRAWHVVGAVSLSLSLCFSNTTTIFIHFYYYIQHLQHNIFYKHAAEYACFMKRFENKNVFIQEGCVQCVSFCGLMVLPYIIRNNMEMCFRYRIYFFKMFANIRVFHVRYMFVHR